jgi:hypothetical protein
MDNDSKTTVGPKLQRMMRASNARTVKDDTTRRTAARKAYRAKIESLLDESRDERLADVWQRLYPLPIDPASELPDRRGIIEDLADFAEALQPSLDGMKADRLCRLIEKYAAWESHQSDLSLSHTASFHRSGELVRGRGPLRVEAGYRDDQVAFM